MMLVFFYLLIIPITLYLLKLFINLAKKNNIVSIGNNKNMHKGSVPRGAGIVFGTIYMLFLILSFHQDHLSFSFFLPLIFGSFTCLLLGFLDDIYDLKLLLKLLLQILITLPLIIFIFFSFNLKELTFLDLISILIITSLCVFLLNIFNFMDGTDGHLSSLACMQCILMIVLIYINQDLELILPIFILLSLLIIFLKFNWSPAKIFMGDAGSLFIGINLIIFILIAYKFISISPIVMLIIFSYCVIDGFGTVFIRLFFKKQWKKRHKSHPYQNFAMLNNHSSISKYVIILHLVWLLPLSLLANELRNFQFVILILSLVPSIIFFKKFGPNFSPE